MKKIIYLTAALIAVFLVFAQLKYRIIPGVSTHETTRPTVTVNGKVIGVDIADNAEAWRQGLSGRATLGADEGMLFVFPDKQVRNFWMKDMNFPLDIIWIDDDTIAHLSADLPPEGEAPENIYDSALPVNYVLEVNAGFTDEYNVKVGDKILINR